MRLGGSLGKIELAFDSFAPLHGLAVNLGLAERLELDEALACALRAVADALILAVAGFAAAFVSPVGFFY